MKFKYKKINHFKSQYVYKNYNINKTMCYHKNNKIANLLLETPV